MAHNSALPLVRIPSFMLDESLGDYSLLCHFFR